MTINGYGDSRGLVRHQAQDFIPFELLASEQRPAWTRDEKLIAKRILDVSLLNGREVIPAANMTSKVPSAVDAIIRHRMAQQRPERGPQSPNAHACHTVERAAKDTGLSEQSVLAEARTIGALAVDARRDQSKLFGRCLIAGGVHRQIAKQQSGATQTGVRP